MTATNFLLSTRGGACIIADLEDVVIWTLVTVDDLWQTITSLYDRSGPTPTRCNDSELITVVIVSECRSWDRKAHLMTE